VTPNIQSGLLIVFVAYLLGSIPFGLLIVKISGGGDIRKSGSGNIGAANVARNAGAIAGVLTLLLDAAKGYLAVFLAARWTGENIPWMTAAAFAGSIAVTRPPAPCFCHSSRSCACFSARSAFFMAITEAASNDLPSGAFAPRTRMRSPGCKSCN